MKPMTGAFVTNSTAPRKQFITKQ